MHKTINATNLHQAYWISMSNIPSSQIRVFLLEFLIPFTVLDNCYEKSMQEVKPSHSCKKKKKRRFYKTKQKYAVGDCDVH